MDNIDLNNTYWDKLKGFVTELRIDARWILRDKDTEKPYGSLRIVSHPDLPPGHLRSFFTYVTSIKVKDVEEKLKTIEDYQMDVTELEVYSINEEIKTENKTYEAPYKELEEMFGIKMFE